MSEKSQRLTASRLRLVVLDGLARPGILDDPPEDLLEQAYADVSEPKGRVERAGGARRRLD